jgi:hypothetical protein
MKAAYDRLAGAHLDSTGLLCLPTLGIAGRRNGPRDGPVRRSRFPGIVVTFTGMGGRRYRR